MGSFTRQILAEKENVEKVLSLLKTVIARKEKSVVELAAFATFLHNIYNGIENILKQVLKAKDVEIPKSETWHKDLLNLSVSIGVISEGLADKLYEYLTFRHFFIYAYGFMLEEAQLVDLITDIPKVWSQFLSEMENFLKKQTPT